MKAILLWSLLLIAFHNPMTWAIEEYELLFADNLGKLSKSDMRSIFKDLGYTVKLDGKGLESGECGQVDYQTSIVDLNHDGTLEVFVISGNCCTSGRTCSSIDLFIKDITGRYSRQLGFPASDYSILDTSNKGFPDLVFGGPGFCHGVWRWSGIKYEFRCGYEAEPGACKRRGAGKVCP
jgi:hypothetical protein